MPGGASEVDMCGANKIWSLVPKGPTVRTMAMFEFHGCFRHGITCCCVVQSNPIASLQLSVSQKLDGKKW